MHQNPGEAVMPREMSRGTLHNVCFLLQIYSKSVFCFLAFYMNVMDFIVNCFHMLSTHFRIKFTQPCFTPPVSTQQVKQKLLKINLFHIL